MIILFFLSILAGFNTTSNHQATIPKDLKYYTFRTTHINHIKKQNEYFVLKRDKKITISLVLEDKTRTKKRPFVKTDSEYIMDNYILDLLRDSDFLNLKNTYQEKGKKQETTTILELIFSKNGRQIRKKITIINMDHLCEKPDYTDVLKLKMLFLWAESYKSMLYEM